jgi:hypothetical protein
MPGRGRSHAGRKLVLETSLDDGLAVPAAASRVRVDAPEEASAANTAIDPASRLVVNIELLPFGSFTL